METGTTISSAEIPRASVRSIPAKLAVAWCFVILLACWIPRQSLPISEPTGTKRISIDKLVHFGMFAILGGFLAASSSTKRRIAILFVVGVAVAVISELGQNHPLVGRDASFADGIADVSGLITGIALTLAYLRSRRPTSPIEPG